MIFKLLFLKYRIWKMERELKQLELNLTTEASK